MLISMTAYNKSVGLVSILGIDMSVLPAGILGVAFVDDIQKRHRGERIYPPCGKNIYDPPENTY